MIVLRYKNKKSTSLLCSKGIADADCLYFCFRKIQSFLDLHKRQTAHVKHKEIRIGCKHDMSSFVICCATFYAYFLNLSIVF